MLDNFDKKNIESIEKMITENDEYLKRTYRMAENEGTKNEDPIISSENRKKCAETLLK